MTAHAAAADAVPVHVVPDDPRHGVARYALEVADAVGARVVDVDTALAMPPTRVHVHVTDRLFGASAEDAAAVLTAIGRRHRATLTLHDLPQPGEGAGHVARATAYRSVVAASAGVVVSSQHEAGLARAHLGAEAAVVHLPVPVAPRALPCSDPGLPVIGVLGWVYPGKGHDEVVRAAGGLGRPVRVRALGAVSPGHDDVVDALEALAGSGPVRVEVTGWVPEAGLPAALGAVNVPVAWHHHVSASGSINSWIAAGRRPVVPDGPYPRELEALRPGTLRLTAPGGLAEAVRDAVADPASTWLPAGTDVRPRLAEVAQAYRRWWG